ncbi:MAG: AAA family ATPase [Synergistaceae bacterium]|nr:AAA family ATPase [Synergistaceae bacterium]
MFRKAERRKAKLRLAITGPAGSGKTYGALLIAQGLGGKIAMIDTENGSGDIYAGMCDYDIETLNAPYDPRRYIDAIHEAEKAGYSVVIIDSLSHAWNGAGGVLDLQSRVAETMKTSNGYVAWGKVTPLQNALVEAMIVSPCHIIATMRSKTDYVQSRNDSGRTEIRKVGLAPVQRDGMEYEFGTVFDLAPEHTASVSKDRTGLFDGQYFTISAETGRILRKWLDVAPSEMKGANKQ